MRCNIVANRGIIWRGWWMLRIWSTSNNNNSSAHQISMFMIPGTNQAITTDRIVSPTSVRGTACFLPLLLLLDTCIHTHTDCAHYAHTFYDFQLIAEWPRIEFAELKPKHKSPSVNDRRYALGWTFVWRWTVVSEGQATIDLIIIIYHHNRVGKSEREKKRPLARNRSNRRRRRLEEESPIPMLQLWWTCGSWDWFILHIT